MHGKLDAVAREALEDHELRLFAFSQRRRVEAEGDLRLFGCRLGDELRRSRDFLPIYQEFICRDAPLVVGRLLHQSARDGVALSGHEVAVTHGVHEGDVGLAHELVIAVGGIARACGDLRSDNANGLALVACIGVGGHDVGAVPQLLEDHDLASVA